ncbi:hypothetical protein D3D03_11525 [Exiguobacterium sp. RIT452]|jgi:hypothetical protein|uniref:Uncharacterized protein n=1 Tax=Exiguobacterium undae TaxID=169177 RepID=A0ABX2V9W7_9BACL|nr:MULTISPECIES: hypothetical protein [Exiguobacterium]MCK2156400.1 hypothetical protein [Exiguobacterium sp. 17-1]OAN14594.1 hypothetical protein A3783_01300 [Exiguobacterium undae]RJO98347.1 hypothetical protein D3D03_11525 [Exiguobacterium sp. RIT452]
MKEEHSMKVVSCLNDFFQRNEQPLQVDLLRGLPPVVLLLKDEAKRSFAAEANLHDELLSDIKRLVQECLDPQTLRELDIDVDLPEFFVTRAPLYSAHHYLVTFIED